MFLSRKREIQDNFKHIHIRGEWFSATPELLGFIEEQESEPFESGIDFQYLSKKFRSAKTK